MKKVLAFLISAVLVILCLFFANSYLQKDISKKYYDKIGDIVNPAKYEGIILQKEASKRSGNLFLYGSSEVGGTKSTDPYHPSNFFSNRKDGFQVELIGRGHCQSIIHAMNIGALGKNLEDKKVVLIVSPQWFNKTGLIPQNFNMNFSEEQFLGFMLNKDLSNTLKRTMAKRILRLTDKNSDYAAVRDLAYLVSKNDAVSKARLLAEMPYFEARFYLLKMRDEIQSERMIKNPNSIYKKVPEIRGTNIDWNYELNHFKKHPIIKSLGFDEDIYNKLYKDKLGLIKSRTKYILRSTSPEYQDFVTLLETFKEAGIRPLIVDMPMDGRWYDYCGFTKQDRQFYYEKINSIVNSFGFEIFDMSKYEYLDYMFKDPYHIEGKGWIYIDEAIDKYYHENFGISKK